ncbi:DUF1287 domain-containing protein [Akkermansiaceae bacterium]|nr:DUF1287 domain-containing protein [Akkermansiaceae bacterium]MDB4309445.1 DUF1287 domain-containing protein [Akkermansiaceae bacterium]MDB4322404.1 DUF1287 domain-containing protein [Akkermansiaceae bacterium]MDB4328060.1 DUF1287 domain-containing protein [Akkermansiaceae bacterium]MDB4333850.1 DUF1287 domain-containing protein [Akkermansiaceae bacterium]
MKRLFLLVSLCLLSCQAELSPAPPAAEKAYELVKAARAQVGVTTSYDPAYVSLKYPGGDLPIEKGVCTDVAIRSLRGVGFDLQKLVHEDMKKNSSKYPKIWGLKRADRSIDHRRVPNLKTYFKRRGIEKKITKDKRDYLAGDFVICTVAGKLPHIMVVSDKRAKDGTPLVIHNIGSGAKEVNSLFEFPITGHYRWFEKK